jgi:hypothetical protein
MDIEEAKLIIAEDKKDRAKKAMEAFNAICKEFNVEFTQVAEIGEETIPLDKIIKFKIGLNINAL